MNTDKVQVLQKNNIPFEENVDLKKKTWIHRGGIAKLFIVPSNIEELQDCIRFMYKLKQDFLLIGHTSNLYIHNDCNIEVVIATSHCNSFSVKEGLVECDCGAAVSKVAKASIAEGFQGMEYLTTLPGTIAAAIHNNSTVKESKVAELLVDLDFIDENGHLRVLKPEDLKFSFRNSALKSSELRGVILKVRLQLQKGNVEQLSDIARRNEERRKQTLEGPVQNLGCTVNRTFSLGKMPRKYELPLNIYSRLIPFFVPKEKQKAKIKSFILRISGYKELAPYISDKQMITFIWKDENADKLFPRYLQFMKDVYRTDKVEIEEITKN